MPTLYVSTTGSNANNGSQAAPFATIAKASSIAVPGTTIYVAPGIYAGDFVTTASGSASAPISYVSTVPGGAIISGAGNGPQGAVWENHGSYVTIQGFQVTGVNALLGFYITDGASNNLIQGNIVHDILSDANSSAYQNTIKSGHGGAGIDLDTWGPGGYGTGGNSGTVNANMVYNIGPSGATDSLIQGIYMVQSGAVDNNVIYNISSGGIQDWHGGTHENIINNTIDNARADGIIVGADSGEGTADFLNVDDNVITNSARGILEAGSTGTHNTYYNDLVFNDGSNPIVLQNGLVATNTISANPLFVNSAGHDYHLSSGSPAIGAGLLTDAPATDFDGNVRAGRDDIGAFQAGSIPPSPPPQPPPSVLSPVTVELVMSASRSTHPAFTIGVDGTQIGAGSDGFNSPHTFSFSAMLPTGSHTLDIADVSRRGTLTVEQVTVGGTSLLSSHDVLTAGHHLNLAFST